MFILDIEVFALKDVSKFNIYPCLLVSQSVASTVKPKPCSMSFEDLNL